MLTHLNPAQFNEVYSLLEESFPVDERRTYPEQLALLNNPDYHIYVQFQDDHKTLQGFLATWDTPHLCFIEHFAINTKYRNQGIGASLLQNFLSYQTKMVCLEVELPESTLACRRIQFYRRNGLHLNEYPYTQPPLSNGQNSIPLYLMTSHHPLDNAEFTFVHDEIMHCIYKLA